MGIEEEIRYQRSLLEKGNPKIAIARACRIGDGIDQFSEDEKTELIQYFENRSDELQSTFFIPASGSGSRMFGFLHEFIGDEVSDGIIEQTEHFINQIQRFAFYNQLTQESKHALKNGDFNFDELIAYLLNEKGLNFSTIPKGLVPFHRYGNFIITPIQEHLLQGNEIAGESVNFHFTINNDFKMAIEKNVSILEAISGLRYNVVFSDQNPATNSFAFTQTLELARDESNEPITRPSGHGALLKNLSEIESDLIFIRNIDNIQHSNKSKTSIDTRKCLAAKLLMLKSAINEILKLIANQQSYSASLDHLLKNFNIRLPLNKVSDAEFVFNFLNRPLRICGMVANEGQPGGGPFWVKDEYGIEHRQIVEKSQISHQAEQLKLVIRSTHFNPVEIICSIKNYKGEKFNLNDFSDPSQYFVVNKQHKGIPITYIEKPGLWNGGMAKWITLFYEIDKECFSPVKTVLDLLKPAHNE